MKKMLMTGLALAAGVLFAAASACTARPRPAVSPGGLRTFKADKRHLVFPCSRGLRGQNKVFINVDGKPYMSVYDALIAGSNPDH